MNLVSIFEKKLLFTFGRHLWNIFGVGGFFAFLTGIILFINGSLLESAKTKEEYIGKDKLITFEQIRGATSEQLTYQEWLSSSSIKEERLLPYKDWLRKNDFEESSDVKLNKQLKENYSSYQEKFLEGTGNNLLEKYRDYKKPFQKEKERLSKELKSQNKLYEEYKLSVNNRNDIKRGRRLLSPLIVGYGLGVIATASIFSAVLSIERTSSKIKS